MISVMSRQIDGQIELLGRGVEALYSLDELRGKLAAGRRLRIKLGLDPTAPDIHLGHTVVLRKMRQFQDLGHLGVLIIGDYTARIGDPTGRDATRPVLSPAQIDENARTYLDQAGRILDTHADKLEIRRNSQWLADLTFADVLRLTGMVTVQQMLQRDNFKQRMQNQTEIMLSEFMYPIMQGYDSIAIEADVELGGTDQTFNCMAARELMARSGLAKQVVMVMPILAGLDGRDKMSKSKGNYVGVAENPHEMFGKLMSIPDSLMPNYFELLTDLPVDRIHSLTDAQTTHPREAKDILGRIVVEEFHGREAANHASEEFRRRFSEHQLPSDLETRPVSAARIGLLRLIVEVGFASSNSDARRLVDGGGVSLDGEKLTDPTAEIAIVGHPVLKVGKRRVCRLAVKP